MIRVIGSMKRPIRGGKAMAGFRIESRCAQWILVAVLLSGCGGGGGGGGGASAPTTASTEPEPPPTLAVRVAGLGTDYATGAIESILETGQLAVDFLDKASRSAASTFVEPCSNGGRASVSLPVDANLDGKPGAGDTLRVILTNCSVQALGAVATGEFTVRLEAPPGGFVKAYRGLLAFGSSFDLEGTGLVGPCPRLLERLRLGPGLAA